MLYLVLLVFLVFLIFFLGDFILTLKTIKAAGTEKIELNPLMRMRGKFIYFFKLFEISVFFCLIYSLTILNQVGPFYILMVFIFVYSLLVVNNAHVYYKVTKRESAVFKIIFIIIVFAMLLFIYLNYLLYSDLKVSYAALSESYGTYNSLYNQCLREKTNINATSPGELNHILDGLNFSIKR